MPERSTLVLLALSALVLTLSFKDLLISHSGSDQNQETVEKSNQDYLPDKDFNDEVDFKSNDEEIIEKEIPKLKIKNNNIQQLKFLFW
jgi:hypothetical protein